jgi:hypothetical protein
MKRISSREGLGLLPANKRRRVAKNVRQMSKNLYYQSNSNNSKMMMMNTITSHQANSRSLKMKVIVGLNHKPFHFKQINPGPIRGKQINQILGLEMTDQLLVMNEQWFRTTKHQLVMTKHLLLFDVHLPMKSPNLHQWRKLS